MSLDLRARFWAKTAPGTGGCINWTGAWYSPGRFGPRYGHIKVRGRWQRSHRLIYELEVGPIPVGLIIRHRCDNSLCVNPAHLEVGTIADNNRDRMVRGHGASGERVPSSRLTAVQVADIRERLAAGGVRHRLAREYGVCWNTIDMIERRQTWASV